MENKNNSTNSASSSKKRKYINIAKSSLKRQKLASPAENELGKVSCSLLFILT